MLKKILPNILLMTFIDYFIKAIENGFHPGCENIKLPEAPKEQCSQRLQEKIAKVYTRMTHYGYNINDDIQNNKKFKNPSIYEKLIEHYDIDEFGSSFPSVVIKH